MGTRDKVLELLESTPEAVSGEEIAGRLGVSRNTVWKAVNRLRECGYEIEAVTNSGYRLVSQSRVLNGENIRHYLKGSAQKTIIDVRESVTSTNTVLKEIGENGGLHGMVVIAEEQSAGKGRLGRNFCSPKGTGLYISVLLRPEFSAAESLFITTAAAVAVSQAIEKVSGRQARIKWVNDVYVDTYKVCGILTEASMDFESGGLHYAVLGMGVNVCRPKGGFPPELRETIGVLYEETPPEGVRILLAAEILNSFFSIYDNLSNKTFMKEYQERSLLTGLKVNFQQGNAAFSGAVTGIDEEARLCVRLDDGTEKRFVNGEIRMDKDFIKQLRKEA